MAPRVAFILGYGERVGHCVGEMLVKNGYEVVVGSRSAGKGAKESAGFNHVELDVTSVESINKAFKTVNEKHGVPSVVIFNVGIFATLPVDNDPISLPIEAFAYSMNIATGYYAAAQNAVTGFRTLPEGENKLFILTGNITPFLPPFAPWLSIQGQKVVGKYLIELFAARYKPEGIRFYFASEVKTTGVLPGGIVNGPAHATAFESLLKNTGPDDWDVRFITDNGLWYTGVKAEHAKA